MTVTLTPRAEELVREQLASGTANSPEEVIERALESSQVNRREGDAHETSAADAIDQWLAYRKQHPPVLRGLKIEDLIHEGHKY